MPDQRLLEGVRVVEFSRLLAAPFCGLTLSDLGADVIKVESPAGDDARALPPFVASGESAFFHALNRGKRGVVLDLSDDADRETARRLVDGADVVVENLGASIARLGFGYADASRQNERLVWCSVTGLGADRGGRAVDPSLQASMGLMALTGERDGPPLRVPVPLIDFTTGMYAVQSVLTALWRAERTGRGAFLDCALVDAAATLTSSTALLALSGSLEPRRLGSESYLAVPSALFQTSDDEYVQVVAVNDRHWQAICEASGHPEWLDDPRCADDAARIANRELVHGRIREVIATRAASDWVERITRAGGLCERVREIGEAWADPLLAERGLVGRLESDVLGGMPLPVVSLARSADPHALAAGPALGEHTEEVMRELEACSPGFTRGGGNDARAAPLAHVAADKVAPMAYNVPDLPYDYGALEPHIDEETMRIHHDKHHQAYVDKANAALEGTEWADLDVKEVLTKLGELPEGKRGPVRNNAGGHYNHSLFWESMSPDGGGEPDGELGEAIASTFGSYDDFKAKLKEAGIGQFGSGWAWLVQDGSGLAIVSTANQDNPVTGGQTPLLGVDVWEHAYYLKYQNKRPDYLDAWFNTINWQTVAQRYGA